MKKQPLAKVARGIGPPKPANTGPWDDLQRGKPGRKKEERAPYYKPGYGPGRCGLDLEILLAAHQSTILTKVNALRKEASWAIHYKCKAKFEALRAAFTEKFWEKEGRKEEK